MNEKTVRIDARHGMTKSWCAHIFISKILVNLRILVYSASTKI